MSSFDIYADSAANLTKEMTEQTGIKIIPFTYTVNGEEKLCFEEDKPFAETAKRFYTDLAEGKEIKTSLVGEAAFAEAVTPSLDAGKDVLIVTITESLSGTYAQALKAQKALSEKYPERKICVVDSANASLGEGMVALQAAKLQAEGKSAEECKACLDEFKYTVNSYVTVNDLKYLRKSGRVSAVIAIAGAILNIKPMLKADGASPATLSVYAKERGRKKSVDALIKGFTDNVINPAGQTVAITHCDCEEEALALADRLKSLGAEDVVIEYYDLCTGSHVGPGTLAVFFTGKDRRPADSQPKKLFGRK